MVCTCEVCFSLTVAELADTVLGAALKHRISCTLVSPPVEPAKPKRSVGGSAPFEAVMLWLVITGM